MPKRKLNRDNVLLAIDEIKSGKWASPYISVCEAFNAHSGETLRKSASGRYDGMDCKLPRRVCDWLGVKYSIIGAHWESEYLTMKLIDLAYGL